MAKIYTLVDNTDGAADWQRHLLHSEYSPEDNYMFGFVTNYAGTQQTTIAFDAGTYTFTLAPTGTDWEYYRNGIRYVVTGSKTSVLSGTPPAKGHYYIYIDATDGTLTNSTSSWTLEDTKVPVATVTWDDDLTPKYWLSDERHTCAIDRRYHWEHHFSDGTEVITLPALSGYTVQPASPADTDNTFGISSGVTSDEDLKHVLAELTDPNGTATDYVVFFRVSAGVWDWEASAMPYRYTAADYIEYDNAATMTTGQNNKWYNSFLLLTNYSGAARFALIPGQAEHSSLADAQAEKFEDLTTTGLPLDEYVAVYQLIWRTNSSYTTKGKCRLAATPIEISISASGAGSPGATVWGNIVGDITNQTDITYGNISAIDPATDVTAAELEELSDGSDTTLHNHDALYDLETIIPAADAKTLPVSDDLFNLLDSEDSYSLKKITWWNVRGTLNIFFNLVYVALTGNQSIAGVKTFTSFPVTPSSAPTTDYQVANKKYVDDNAGAGGQYRAFAWEAVSGGGWTFVSDGADSPSLLLTDLE